jgi:hypothetical protein
MPLLCGGCVTNRRTINELELEVDELKAKIIAEDDRHQLERIKDEVISHLKSEGALLSPRNMVQAMFRLNYAMWHNAEWRDGKPTCGYEK